MAAAPDIGIRFRFRADPAASTRSRARRGRQPWARGRVPQPHGIAPYVGGVTGPGLAANMDSARRRIRRHRQPGARFRPRRSPCRSCPSAAD